MGQQGVDFNILRNLNPPKKKGQKKNRDLNSVLNKEISLGGNKFSDKQKESFYLELKNMLEAGFDIRTSLDLIENNFKNQSHKKIIRALKEAVIMGSTLSEALKRENDFSTYEYYSIQIGEETGRLGKVLEELSLYYSKKLKQRRQFISAISYPIVIVLTSIAAIFFMLYFIVPMFMDVFSRFGGELPVLTESI